MTKLLVKLFIKNGDKVEDKNVRISYGVLASVVGIICNAILFGVKLGAGIFLNSISVMADAFNNLSDATSSIISFFGVKLAGRPADKEHPFGHGRFEYIAALVVAFLIFQVGFSLFKNSFTKILKPEQVKFHLGMLIILGVSVLVKIWLVVFNRTLGKRINSAVMKATAADALGDVIVTLATMVSIIIAGVTKWNIDGYMGLAVSVIVLLAGYGIAKETLEPLLGEAVDREVYEKIKGMVESYEGIEGTHDLIIHNYGPSHRMATIHAEVSNSMGFEHAHETIDRIEREIQEKMDIFLVIHMDPVEVNNEEVLAEREMLEKIIADLEPKAGLHDFRRGGGELQRNFIFDLVVPYSYSDKEKQDLLKLIQEEVRRIDSRYNCIITIENSYIAEE